MSSTARSQKHRQKLKENAELYAAHLEQERTRDFLRRQERKKKMQDPEALQEQRKNEAQRKKKYRKKKKQLELGIEVNPGEPLGPYSCAQTLGKAMTKVKNAFPACPTKQKTVTMKLMYEQFSVEELKKIVLEKKRRSRSAHISESEKKQVMEFYLSENHSWQAPGLKDTKSLKNLSTGKKEHIPKKYLIMTVAELYSLYCESHPNTDVKKSYFYQLKPQHVFSNSEMPHNVCTCVYHENFKYLIVCISNNILGFPSDIKTVLEKICCDLTNEKCMLNQCTNCLSIGALLLEEIDASSKVQLRQWGKKEGENRLILMETEVELRYVINLIQGKLEHFKTHYFIDKTQSQFFRQIRENIPDDFVVMQVDFSEKFTIKFQDEAQSAYYNQRQIMVFTCCVWSSKQKESLVVISNYVDQNKYAVWCCLNTIINHVKIRIPSMKRLLIFSDGAGSQFKNKYTLSNLVFAKEDYNTQISWSFSATAHGKGAVDGIGATLKKCLWSAIKSRKVVMNDVRDCHSYAEKNITGIKTFVITKEEIESLQIKLEHRWSKLRPIPNVKKNHYFEAFDTNTLGIKTFFHSQNVKKHRILKATASTKRRKVSRKT